MYLIMKSGSKIKFSHVDIMMEFMALNFEEVVEGYVKIS